MNHNSLALLGSLLATTSIAIANPLPLTASTSTSNSAGLADRTGQQVLLAQASNPIEAIQAVGKAVLKDASDRTGIPQSELNIVEVKQETWPDSCLGLETAGTSCAQATVPGWKMVVSGGEQRLVYRTNLSGSAVKLDAAASQIKNAQTTPRLSTQASPSPATTSPPPSIASQPSSSSPAARPPATTPQITTPDAPLPNPNPAQMPLRLVRIPQPQGVSPRSERPQPSPAVKPSPSNTTSQANSSNPARTPTVKPSPSNTTTQANSSNATRTPTVKPSPSNTTTARTNSSTPTRTAANQRQTSRPQATSPRKIKLEFTDVPDNYWARDFIAELVQRDIIKGNKGRFRPDDPMTRGEFSALIALAFNKKPIIRPVIDFADIKPERWEHSYLLDAYQRGFFEVGPNKEINPNQKISRLGVIVALTRGLQYSPDGSPETILQVYRDAATIPSSFRIIVAAATEKNLVVNYPNVKLLKPNKGATRAEVAAFIYQAMASDGNLATIPSPYIVTAK
ncbi:MAG: S-layer homology domain-containing protein [Cyanosarcina radialis HA8281-LM2]|jgi:hypothetical protein|nr:S-layer homology domain-containing protein [Cyanosarcina radialis HA8281-LM2]